MHVSMSLPQTSNILPTFNILSPERKDKGTSSKRENMWLITKLKKTEADLLATAATSATISQTVTSCAKSVSSLPYQSMGIGNPFLQTGCG